MKLDQLIIIERQQKVKKNFFLARKGGEDKGRRLTSEGQLVNEICFDIELPIKP